MATRQFHLAASISLDELLENVEVDTYDGPYGVLFLPNDTDSWKAQPDILFGACFTLELPRSVTAYVVRRIIIRAKTK